MSEKEKNLVETIKEFPPEIQDKFETMAEGVKLALDSMKDKQPA